MIQLVRGFRDILPDEVESWKHIENIAAGLFTAFGFREIRTPILENTALFQRSIGEHTDIVEKEMYTFPGSRDAMLTLRPEATASVVRAYIQQRLYAVDPVQKLYTIGPMFRRERPQKGRYRQFYQINAEVFGIASPLMDAQLIVMLNHLFATLGITGLSIQLNSLGCPACRPDFKAALSDRLKAADGLCGDKQIRGHCFWRTGQVQQLHQPVHAHGKPDGRLGRTAQGRHQPVVPAAAGNGILGAQFGGLELKGRAAVIVKPPDQPVIDDIGNVAAV
jgi:histidyl-tRNA synthetase